MKTVTIEIDGVALEAQAGEMLISVADRAGVTIPRFCYHKKLSIAANCRMCLVEVERAPKPLPACATPVMDGMKVFTQSEIAREAQKGTMEFLLINHPLDCPVCDQGGECELQDLAMGYGGDVSRFSEGKRIVLDKNIGPLIATDMTRCIHCTRCVRFGAEIAGVRELGATGRGDHMLIGTYIEKSIDSELSGNVIDLCPVGALTAKPSRYTSRPWELKQYNTIAGHDSIGSHLSVHVRRNQIIRVVPQEHEAINETWLSDRDRFSYEGVYSDERLTQPMVKINGKWQDCDWETALTAAKDGLQLVLDKQGVDQVGAVLSATSTLEELYLSQKLCRDLGVNNIDHRLQQSDFSQQDQAPSYYWLGQSLADLENLDAVLLIGSNVRKDLPIVAHRLRKAALKGASVMLINPMPYEFSFTTTAQLTGTPDAMVQHLAGVAKAILKDAEIPTMLSDLLSNIESSEAQCLIADKLQAEKSSILLGQFAMAHPSLSVLQALAQVIAEHSQAVLGYLPTSSNSVGAYQIGAMPSKDKPGKHAKDILSGLKGYLLLGVEPEVESCLGAHALQALNDAEQVVVLSAYKTPAMEQYADVLLPIGTFMETAGTFVNLEAKWQSFQGVCKPLGDARPAWKVLRVLGNQFELEGYDYHSIEDVRADVQTACQALISDNKTLIQTIDYQPMAAEIIRTGEIGMYAGDAILRRAQALQNTQDANVSKQVWINANFAKQLKLQDTERVKVSQGDLNTTMALGIDDTIPDGCARILANADLSDLIGSISLAKA